MSAETMERFREAALAAQNSIDDCTPIHQVKQLEAQLDELIFEQIPAGDTVICSGASILELGWEKSINSGKVPGLTLASDSQQHHQFNKTNLTSVMGKFNGVTFTSENAGREQPNGASMVGYIILNMSEGYASIPDITQHFCPIETTGIDYNTVNPADIIGQELADEIDTILDANYIEFPILVRLFERVRSDPTGMEYFVRHLNATPLHKRVQSMSLWAPVHENTTKNGITLGNAYVIVTIPTNGVKFTTASLHDEVELCISLPPDHNHISYAYGLEHIAGYKRAA